jgi:hypothetical protein
MNKESDIVRKETIIAVFKLDTVPAFASMDRGEPRENSERTYLFRGQA